LNDLVKNIILWAVIAVVLMSVFNNFSQQSGSSSSAMSYSQFIEAVKSGRVRSVMIDGDTLKGVTDGGNNFTTYTPR